MGIFVVDQALVFTWHPSNGTCGPLVFADQAFTEVWFTFFGCAFCLWPQRYRLALKKHWHDWSLVASWNVMDVHTGCGWGCMMVVRMLYNYLADKGCDSISTKIHEDYLSLVFNIIILVGEFQWIHASSSSLSPRFLISYPRHILHCTLLPLVFDYHHLGRWTKQILLRESEVFQQRFMSKGTFFVIPTTSLLSWPQRLHSCCSLGCWPHDTWRKWNHSHPKVHSIACGWVELKLPLATGIMYTVYFYYGRHDLMHPVASIHSMKSFSLTPWRNDRLRLGLTSMEEFELKAMKLWVDHKRDTWTCNLHEGLSQFLADIPQ